MDRRTFAFQSLMASSSILQLPFERRTLSEKIIGLEPDQDRRLNELLDNYYRETVLTPYPYFDQ